MTRMLKPVLCLFVLTASSTTGFQLAPALAQLRRTKNHAVHPSRQMQAGSNLARHASTCMKDRGTVKLQEHSETNEAAPAGPAATAMQQLAVLSNDEEPTFSNVLGFYMACTFLSPVYIGSHDLHLGIPLPEIYPDWLPEDKRLPQGAQQWAERAIDAGLLRRAAADERFEIKYGVLRGVSAAKADCEPCETARRAALREQAAEGLTVIGEEERGRRRDVGTYMAGAGSIALTAAIATETGPPIRFCATLMLFLGVAFLESARTGL
jgi:hypothetical protein